MVKVVFRTLGCKQNQFDTSALRHALLSRGEVAEKEAAQADVLYLNTCAVTQRAIAKARGMISHMRRLQPQLQVIAWGCGVAYQPDNFTSLDGCVRGVNHPADCPYNPSLDAKIGVATVVRGDLTPPHGLIPQGKTRALLRIQSGCHRQCAYCIVPSLRGAPLSVPLQDCVTSLRELVNQGAPEIVLTGTNITLWGVDLPGQPTLLDLLKALVSQVGPARLRLSSLEPEGITPAFLEWCLQQPNLCRHFHFAFQSGASEVLYRMQRERTAPELYAYLRNLSRQHPEVCLGSDLVVGFPGESESDFAATVAWVQSIPLNYLHIFPFSEREGTAAAHLNRAVPLAQRRRRAYHLRQLNAVLKKDFVIRNLSQIQDVIAISSPQLSTEQGLTSNYLRLQNIGTDRGNLQRFKMMLQAAHSATLVH